MRKIIRKKENGWYRCNDGFGGMMDVPERNLTAAELEEFNNRKSISEDVINDDFDYEDVII